VPGHWPDPLGHIRYQGLQALPQDACPRLGAGTCFVKALQTPRWLTILATKSILSIKGFGIGIVCPKQEENVECITLLQASRKRCTASVTCLHSDHQVYA